MHTIELKPGTRFGRLTVISRGEKLVCKHITWKCKCECGVVKDYVSQALRDGRSKSCGCLQRDRAREMGQSRRKTYGESSVSVFVKNVRESAANRGLVLKLSKKQIIAISLKPCHYCGRSGTSTTKLKNGFGEFKHVGIDRVDNSVGYLITNIVPCCSDCNRAKGTLSYSDFIAWVHRVVSHSKLITCALKK